MPRYHIDFEDGDTMSIDYDGIDLPDLKAACDAAISILPDMAQDELPDGASFEFKSSVRDDKGNVVFKSIANASIRF